MEKQTNAFQISICKLLFPYTVELARNGNYKGAEASLRFMLDNDISPEYLLLLGKIYAQQRNYQDAIVEWKKVLDLDPGNHEANAAIAKAEELEKGISPYQLNKLKLISWLIGFFLMLSFLGNYLLWQKKENITDQYGHSLKNNLALSSRYKEIEKELQAVKKEIDISKKYQEIKVKYKDVERENAELKAQKDKQLIISLEKKIRDHLTEKGLAGFTITIKQKDGHVRAYGDMPTSYLRDSIRNLLNGVDITGIEISHKYTIEIGDELGKIAQKLYGDIRRWKDIFEANQSKITNRHIIQPGLILSIP